MGGMPMESTSDESSSEVKDQDVIVEPVVPEPKDDETKDGMVNEDITSSNTAPVHRRLTGNLPANYEKLGPAEQCLARRRLIRRPQTHIRVLEALLEEIK